MSRGRRSFGNRDVIVCNVALQDHVIKALHDPIVRSPSSYVTILPRLVARDAVVFVDIKVSVTYLISRDHMIERSRDLMGRSLIK